MAKEGNEDFKNSTKCWICDNGYVDNDVKVRAHCHITGKYRGFAHGDCNISPKLNQKVPVVFNNLQIYDSHLIMQKLGKVNLKLDIIPNGLEKYMSFTINNKLSLLFLSSALDSLIENLCKKDFKYLSQEFDNSVLDLVR